MKKIDFEKKYIKALMVGNELLQHAQRLDKMADQNPDLKNAIQQRCVANILRDYYSKMFE